MFYTKYIIANIELCHFYTALLSREVHYYSRWTLQSHEVYRYRIQMKIPEN